MKIVKGVVVKITKKEMVLLTDEGTFKNVPYPKSSTSLPLIGQQYSYTVKKKKTFSYLPYSSAACLFLLIAIYMLFPFGGQAEEAFIVTIDINPSIEVISDEKLRVTRARGLNDDGERLLATMELESNLYEAMEQIIEETVKRGFIAKQIDPIVYTSIIPLGDKQMDIAPKVEEIIETSLQVNNEISAVIVTTDKQELYEEAVEAELSIHSYKEYQKLKEKGIVEKKEEVKGKSLAELRKMEAAQKKEAKQQEKLERKNENKMPPNDTENRGNSGKNAVPLENKKNNQEIRGKPNQERSNNGNGRENKGKGLENKENIPAHAPENKGNSDRGNGKQQGNMEKGNEKTNNPKNKEKGDNR